jgi:hypothetical protein
MVFFGFIRVLLVLSLTWPGHPDYHTHNLTFLGFARGFGWKVQVLKNGVHGKWESGNSQMTVTRRELHGPYPICEIDAMR